MSEDLEEQVGYKMCMHKFFGDCPDCERDYESEINNTHCPNYCEIMMYSYIVKD